MRKLTLNPLKRFNLTMALAGVGGIGTPDYANPGGSGDRSSSGIVITSTLPVGGGSPATGLLDGVKGVTTDYYANTTVSGLYLQVDLGQSALIDQWKLFSETGSNPWGVWQPQVSSNGSDWTSIGSTQAMTGTSTIDFTGNTDVYRYYRILGTSGSIQQTFNYELEFRIAGFS